MIKLHVLLDSLNITGLFIYFLPYLDSGVKITICIQSHMDPMLKVKTGSLSRSKSFSFGQMNEPFPLWGKPIEP